MFIQNTLKVINTFQDRYVGYNNEIGDYTQIHTIGEKVRFTFNNDYHIIAWIEDGELKIENEYGESIFDCAQEFGWSEEDVNYIKYGRRQTHEKCYDGNYKNN